MELAPGTVIDRYTVEAQIGEGGMARVFRVRHNQLGTAHALKVLLLPAATLQERLHQEGRVQASLRHVNIVTVTDMITVEGAPGLVMDYIEGPSLEQLLREGTLSVAEIDGIARGILSGVAAAHKREFIHRDLKPANILMGGEDERTPKITDFGLAKMFDVGSGESGQLTRSGLAMGTPAYMSPEQIRDAKNVDSRADIFSVGVILYELVTRRRAFGEGDMLEIFNRIAHADYIPVREHVPDVPSRMERAIEAAIVVDLNQRVGDCDLLLRMWNGEHVEMRSTSMPQVLSARDRSGEPVAALTPETINLTAMDLGVTREQIAAPALTNLPSLAPQDLAPTLAPAPLLPPGGPSTPGVASAAILMTSGGLFVASFGLVLVALAIGAGVWAGAFQNLSVIATVEPTLPTLQITPTNAGDNEDGADGSAEVRSTAPEPSLDPDLDLADAAVAELELEEVEEVQLPNDCGELVDLEGPAREGRLTPEQLACLDGLIAGSDSQTEKKKLSLVLLVNAEAALVGDQCADFDARYNFHISEIDRSDPEFMYNWVVHLSELQHAGQVRERIDWSNRALEAKAYWPPSIFSKRVSTLHRARTLAAYALYLAANDVYLQTKKPLDEEKRDRVRLEAKNYSVEWIAYDHALGKDTSKAVEICSIVAGIGTVCTLDGEAPTEPVELKGKKERKR